METFVRLKILLKKDDGECLKKLQHLGFDRVWKKGDIRPNTKIIEKADGCIISSGEGRDASLEHHLNSLLLVLQNDISSIKELSKNNTVEVSCAIYSSEIPSLYFDQLTISRIAEFGASLDIDFYLLPTETR